MLIRKASCTRNNNVCILYKIEFFFVFNFENSAQLYIRNVTIILIKRIIYFNKFARFQENTITKPFYFSRKNSDLYLIQIPLRPTRRSTRESWVTFSDFQSSDSLAYILYFFFHVLRIPSIRFCIVFFPVF